MFYSFGVAMFCFVGPVKAEDFDTFVGDFKDFETRDF